MRSSISTVVCLVALLLAIAGYIVSKPSPPTATVVTTQLHQERDEPVKPIETPSHWRATGKDQAGRLWEGYLVVDRAATGYMRAGWFEWGARGGGGRYHFEGTFDPGTRAVRWTGYSIQDRFGLPAMATYMATLSEDGKQFADGSWSGGISVPGTWTAEYIGD